MCSIALTANTATSIEIFSCLISTIETCFLEIPDPDFWNVSFEYYGPLYGSPSSPQLCL